MDKNEKINSIHFSGLVIVWNEKETVDLVFEWLLSIKVCTLGRIEALSIKAFISHS